MKYRDVRERGLLHMQTGKPSVTDDPHERVVVELEHAMHDSRLLALLRLLAEPHEIARQEMTELRQLGYLPEAGLTLTTNGWLKLAELEIG